MNFRDIPKNQIIKFNLDSERILIPGYVVGEIITIIRDAWSKDQNPDTWDQVFSYSACNDSIEWVWITSRGTLPKRIANWYYKAYNKQLDATIVSKIGNIVRAAMPKDQVYYFDIVDKLNWRAGDFGDHGSCFFSSSNGRTIRGHSPYLMEKDGRFKAIRFFKPIDNSNTTLSGSAHKFYENKDFFYYGISRAWIYEHSNLLSAKVGGVEIKDTVQVIFNGYGLTTKSISQIFSKYMDINSTYDISYKNIRFEEEYDMLYINDNGYVIGRDEIIERVDDIIIRDIVDDDEDEYDANTDDSIWIQGDIRTLLDPKPVRSNPVPDFFNRALLDKYNSLVDRVPDRVVGALDLAPLAFN